MSGNHVMAVAPAAEELGISPGGLYNLLRRNEIPYAAGPGKKKHVSVDVAREFLRKRYPTVKKFQVKTPSVPSVPTDVTPSENPLLKAWWERTIVPLLAEQGIRGITWTVGGSPVVEVVMKVTL